MVEQRVQCSSESTKIIALQQINFSSAVVELARSQVRVRMVVVKIDLSQKCAVQLEQARANLNDKPEKIRVVSAEVAPPPPSPLCCGAQCSAAKLHPNAARHTAIMRWPPWRSER